MTYKPFVSEWQGHPVYTTATVNFSCHERLFIGAALAIMLFVTRRDQRLVA
jgi:hypothetical protein